MRHRLRRGLTLIEVMLALVLLAIGLLGIAGSSAIMLRAANAHAGLLHATSLAALRIVRLESGGCTAARSGATVHPARGVTERWTVTGSAATALLVDDSIAWTGPGGARQLVIRSALLC